MFGMLKMLPLLLLIAGGAYAYHTTTVAQKNVTIAQLEANIVTLRNNVVRLETAYETEAAARERVEQNLTKQLEMVGALTEKTNALQAEMDDYLSIFKRHDLTRLARAKPGLIEPRINKGTKEVFRAIEEASQEVENADSQ
jgi:hypothetical protein